MKQYLSVAFLLISGILFGQETKFDRYNWNATPEVLQKRYC